MLALFAQGVSVLGVSVGGIWPWGKCPGGTCPGGGGYVLKPYNQATIHFLVCIVIHCADILLGLHDAHYSTIIIISN